MPPVIGYCAVTGSFELTALMLIAVFCTWQTPHSHAITVMHHEDFRAARLPTLTLFQANVQIQAYLLLFLACATLLGLFAQMSALYYCAVLGCGGYGWALAASAMRHAPGQPRTLGA